MHQFCIVNKLFSHQKLLIFSKHITGYRKLDTVSPLAVSYLQKSRSKTYDYIMKSDVVQNRNA